MKYFSRVITVFLFIYFLQACSTSRKTSLPVSTVAKEEAIKNTASSKNNPKPGKSIPVVKINTKQVNAGKVVDFAETLIGTPYKYGSALKERGFDCSGFVTYVFNHFDISVPRISRDFTNAGLPVPLEKSKRGDLVLFTGTDTTGWVVGHMGFITENYNGKIKFIHSSSGRSAGVIISGLSNYYATRLVRVIRVFNE